MKNYSGLGLFVRQILFPVVANDPVMMDETYGQNMVFRITKM